jgi:predicted CXXCH cytochrome family protein
VVCHDPHGSENSAQLRRPVNTTDASQHLCGECHDRQARPDTDLPQDYIRTHAPATGLVAANAGWFPPGSGLQPGSVTHAHGQAERLCASCHVVRQTVVDEATGEEFYGQGHRFIAAPCVDASGMPTGRTGCALTAEARDFTGCLECHSNEAEVETLLDGAVTRLLPKVRTLAGMLARIDPNGSAPGGEISQDYAFTPADGAYFTLTVALSGAGAGTDPQVRRALAAAVSHNPALTEALLDAAIEALDAAYPDAAGAPPAPASWWESWTEH